MLQQIADHPWASLSFVLVIVLLQLAAVMRIRRDRQRKQRALADRRQSPRSEADRRWNARPRAH